MLLAVNLHGISIEFQCADNIVKEQWQVLFDCELSRNLKVPDTTKSRIKLEIIIKNNLPTPPETKPLYTDPVLNFTVYDCGIGCYLLQQHGEAQTLIKFGGYDPRYQEQLGDIVIWMTPKGVDLGVLEDVVMTSLAPLLRRRGFFFIHAFAVLDDSKNAILFVAPSKHGKTTSGLAMIMSGWQLLANDTALLGEDSQGIISLLSPGSVNVRANSFRLIPSLSQYLDEDHPKDQISRYTIPRLELMNSSEITPMGKLKRVYFPQIGDGEDHILSPVPRAVGLAHLMEASMDQWDNPTWLTHLNFLERLAPQVKFRYLTLGNNLDGLPPLINSDLRSHG